MISHPVLAVGIIMNIVAVLFILSSIILILVVLIQKGKGGGLSGAFGGGVAGNLLGSKTGDFLTWLTIVTVGIFLILAVIMDKWYRPSIDYAQRQTQQQPLSGTGTTMPNGQENPLNNAQPVIPDTNVNGS